MVDRTTATRTWRAICAAFATVALVACGGEHALFPTSDEPFVFIALSPPGSAGDSVVRAIVMSSGDPAQVRYLPVQRFVMRRRGDNTPFAWRAVDSPGSPPANYGGLQLASAGNYLLGAPDGAGALGRESLAAGEEYDLELTLSDRIVGGRTRVPGRVQLRIDEVDGRRRLSWSPVAGASLYIVNSETEAFGIPNTTDTMFVLRDDAPSVDPGAMRRVRVYSLDENMARYLSDSTVTRSGVTGAYGVFGGVAMQDTVVPVFRP